MTAHPLRRHTLRGLLAATLAAGLVSGLPPAASAAPAPTGPTPARTAPGPGPHEITLITGDRVTLTESGAGQYIVRSTPGRRADGSRPRLSTQYTPKGVYVLPEDAVAAIDSGLVDRELFNVRYLAENGYADSGTPRIPVIVQYAKGTRARSALPAATTTNTLESLDGAALDVAKAQTARFWDTVAGQAKQRAGGVAKLWLDGKVTPTLDHSVPQIGAPTAWAGGHDGTGVKVAVLDTGVDAAHRDLDGRIAETRSFVPGEAVRDGHGHGTHVAATIAGTGAATGRNKGVAPGAQLVIGKVLGDSGSGQDSWVIEAMEWAARSGAKVVSMSLGSGPTDGTDPVSQALNDLSAATGTLFVVAAGNTADEGTVAAPGSADAALTVAAVDRNDTRAWFSSQGPRFGDSGLKPDLAAPGVSIAAARAAGTSMGEPVDDVHTRASGTSMATPHVSGAVALLAQRHPDWTGPQLKAALIGSAKDTGATVYELGAGRLDVARAYGQTVHTATSGLDFASVNDERPVVKDLAYRNTGDRPVTLTLRASLRRVGGDDASGSLTVADPTLTVPANGTATTKVTLTPAGAAFGAFSGAVTAEADGLRLRTPVGAVRESPKVQLTVRTIGRDGKPANPWAQHTLDVSGTDGFLGGTRLVDTGVTVTRVPPGVHHVTQWIDWADEDDRLNFGYLVDPEVRVDGDTEITLDLRKARQVRFTTPKPAEPLNNDWVANVQRTTAAGEVYGAGITPNSPYGAWMNLWVTPTEKVTVGRLRWFSHWTLGKSELAMSVRGREPYPLKVLAPVHSVNAQGPTQSGHPGFVQFTGIRDLPVADVGQARPEDLAGRDLRGRLVLMDTGMADDGGAPLCEAPIERIGPLREAGAAFVLISPTRTGACGLPMAITQKPFTGDAKPIGVPNAFLSHTEARRLKELLARGPLTLRVAGTPDTPYSYTLKPYDEDRIAADQHRVLTERQLTRVDSTVHAASSARISDWRYVFKQDDGIKTAVAIEEFQPFAYTAPARRTEWVGPPDPAVIQERGLTSVPEAGTATLDTRYRTEAYGKAGRVKQRWFTPGSTPGAAIVPDEVLRLADPSLPPLAAKGTGVMCSICVQQDVLWADFVLTGRSEKQWFQGAGFWKGGMVLTPGYDVRLYRDGRQLDRLDNPWFRELPAFPLQGEGEYRLTAKNAAHDVEWTFRAPPPQGQTQRGAGCRAWNIQGPVEHCRPVPSVFVAYDFGDDVTMDNRVKAGPAHTFRVTAYHSQSTTAMPRIAGLKLWSSTDDGATWTPVDLRRERDGEFTARARYGGRGAVSLRAEAWDADGNRVKLTSPRLFTLR
ncbi:S8 family peptidase [Nonomuraea longicatena]|uniref:S8 family serine peptidase n=1 Tax=Nonomuraea longicatena TaxID=83682 RepID=A0ABP4B5W5_9ACTN